MAFEYTVLANTKAREDQKIAPAKKVIIVPESIAEIEKGIGCFKDLQDLFRCALAHKVVEIQAPMRKALENGNGKASGKAKNEVRTFSIA